MVYTLNDIEGLDLDVIWLVNNWIPTKGTVLFSTASNWGKSTLIAYLACLLAKNDKFALFGQNGIEDSQSVLAISPEAPLDFMRKINVFSQVLELEQWEKGRVVITDEIEHWLDDRFDVIIIDTLSTFMEAKGRSVSQNRDILHIFSQIENCQNCYIFVHHLGKGRNVELGATQLKSKSGISIFGYFSEQDEYGNDSHQSDRLIRQDKNKYGKIEDGLQSVTLRDRGLGALIPVFEPYKDEEIDRYQTWKLLTQEYIELRQQQGKRQSLSGLYNFIVGRKVTNPPKSFRDYFNRWVDSTDIHNYRVIQEETSQ